MNTQLRSRLLGWAILVVCVVAVPVAIFSRSTSTSTTKTASQDKSEWSGFLQKKDHIQVLRLYGPIMDEDDSQQLFGHGDTADYVKRKLHKDLKDTNVKGVLLRINSPGGTVGMSQEVYEAMQALHKKGTPIVVSMGDITASGGYYIASAADHIVANPGTLTGSIGVIMHLLNWQETEKKIGLEPGVIKSGQFKDIGSPDRPMTAAEKALLQDIIMDSYDQFVTAVAQGRNLPKDQVKEIADGRVFSGRQALKVKLVDQLGSYDDAVTWLQATCKKKYDLKEDLPVEDGKYASVLGQLFGSTTSSFSGPAQQTADLIHSILPMSTDPRFNKVPLWIMQ